MDADGTVLAPPTADENAVLVATVHVPPPGAAAGAALPRRSAWRKFSPLAPHPMMLRCIFGVDEAIGALVYRCSGERRRRALAASRGGEDDVVLEPLVSARAVVGTFAVAAVLARRLWRS